jgi:integrative and conjugative element protein (TIGR02256 family)
MTEGQQLALRQLEEIQQADPHALEIIASVPPTNEERRLTIQISLHCGALPVVPGGLPLRARERFILAVPPDFPFAVPVVWANHTRFAGYPHVFWTRWLCLYQAPATEWESADGIFGFIDRLWIWLEHGAANQLNPIGQPLHPPSTFATSDRILVPKVNTPKFEGLCWAGFANLQAVGDRRLDITSWHELLAEDMPPTAKSPLVLLTKEMPWEMPRKLSDLFRHLENAGVSRIALFALLRLSVNRTAEGESMVFILGTPQRGVAGTTDVLQHLMAWEVDSLLVKTLRISLSKFSDYPPLRAIGEEGERLALEVAELVDIHWCRVMECRPEVTIRRDFDAPVSVFCSRSICLWGCGALGSHIAYFLAKAGCAKIILMDSGVVTPGLLVRQMYEDTEVGQAKSETLRARLLKIRPDLVVESHTHNILNDLEPGTDWSHGADFVVDCAASHLLQAKLELVRHSNSARRVPLVSMIVGPRAERGIVVLSPSNFSGGVKDVFRKAKIAACGDRALAAFCEDFYPRGDALKFFQPEPGCSDATFVGSAADVSSLSGSMLNLAARELAKTQFEATAFFITQPHIANANSKERSVARKTWSPDILIETSYEVRLTPTAWAAITKEICASRRKRGKAVETGGVLFGKRDDVLRIIWVDFASGPPTDSKHSRMEFLCGTRGVDRAHKRWGGRTRGSIEYVGMWHTHPECKPRPSGKDWLGMTQILTAGDPPPRKCLLLIVGLQNKNPWLGASVFERKTIETDWHTIEAQPVMKELRNIRI